MTQKTFKIKLFMKSPFIGPIDNIKLFNAFYLTLLMIDKEKAELFRKRVEDNEIVISSAFPIIDDEECFPMPLSLKSKILESLDQDSIKKHGKLVKKTNLITKSLLIELIEKTKNNKNLNSSNINNLIKWVSEKQRELYKNIEVPRNSINRYDSTTNIFISNYLFTETIYFLVKSKESYVEDFIKPSLKVLSKLGLGGDISTGKGNFDYDENIEELEIKNKGELLLISKLIPAKEELEREIPSDYYHIGEFKTINRIGKHIKGIFYFIEGSVFKREVKGELIYKEDARYFVNGKPFFIQMEGLE